MGGLCFFLGLKDGDQLGTQSVALVLVAQARKAQRGGGNQLLRHALVGGQPDVGEVGAQLPATNFLRDVVFLLAAERKDAGHSLLHGVVVIVTHLALAVFKGALAGLPVCEKQIGPGVACGFQPGLHFGAGAGAGQRGGLLCLTGLVNPQLGQRGHALLVIQAGGIGQGVVTHGHIGQTALEVQIQHAQ